MKVILSFDYELFFGEASGSPEKCLVEPTEALAAVAGEYGVPLCFFVDAGYLASLRCFGPNDAMLGRQDAMTRRNLDMLAGQDHEILLHVHPHWEDSVWREGRWLFDLSRFALRDFDGAAVTDIFVRYADELRPHTTGGLLHAYRAGGWAIHPFAPIRAALKSAGIRVDSTVYRGGKDVSGKNYFDFSIAPAKSSWRFETDPLVEDPRGGFLEIPASSMMVSPAYYWGLTFSRLSGQTEAQTFGDGAVRPMRASRSRMDKLMKLTASSQYCVTLDGMKANLVLPEYRRVKQQGGELLVLLSHPKMMTPVSIACLRRLLDEIRANGDEVVGYERFASFDDVV